MTEPWVKALDVMVNRTGHADLRRLCAESHPDHKQWRATLITQAQIPLPKPGIHVRPLNPMVVDPRRPHAPSQQMQPTAGCCGDTPALTVRQPHSSMARPNQLDREVVVARYNENISWLDGVRHFITIYNKGESIPTLGVPHHFQSLPNKGREAGTWLYHIITRYDDLADWTYFLQGDAKKHQPDILERIRVEYKCSSCLSTRYEERSPLPVVKAHDKVWVDNDAGFEMRLGNATVQVHYNIPVWFNVKAWEFVFTNPLPDPLWFCYSAQWAVSRQAIRSRSRAFYAWLLENLTEDGDKTITMPPTNPWSLEALWSYIWDPSYETRVK